MSHSSLFSDQAVKFPPRHLEFHLGRIISFIAAPHDQPILTVSVFESVDGDPGFVGADCPCMCTVYAGCENYGAPTSAPLENEAGMSI